MKHGETCNFLDCIAFFVYICSNKQFINYNVMKTKSVFFISVFTFLLSSVVAVAGELEPVRLRRKVDPILSGSVKPTRAPMYVSLDLSVMYDIDAGMLYFRDSVSEAVEIALYDDQDNMVCNEMLMLSEDETQALTLEGMPSGVYIIVITIAGVDYIGEIDVL